MYLEKTMPLCLLTAKFQYRGGSVQELVEIDE